MFLELCDLPELSESENLLQFLRTSFSPNIFFGNLKAEDVRLVYPPSEILRLFETSKQKILSMVSPQDLCVCGVLPSCTLDDIKNWKFHYQYNLKRSGVRRRFLCPVRDQAVMLQC
jgi:hypothetical protein